mgnify:FL=1|jgi:DNA repair exonuclease SbcCD nuclease subunit
MTRFKKNKKKEGKELLALAFSDLHLNLWAKFNDNKTRTKNGFDVIETLCAESQKRGDVPILFCGDMFHKPENIDQELALMAKSFFDDLVNKFPRQRIYCIEGNHDLKKVNTLGNITKGWISLFQNTVLNVLEPDTLLNIGPFKEFQVHGIPYIDHNTGLSEYLKNRRLNADYKHILLLHTDYPGAKDTDDRRIDSVENLNLNTLSRFDLVLCGHIHKPQKLGKKVYMIGAPLHQRRTDKNCDMGYWEVYTDLSMKFIHLAKYPRFIDVEKDTDVKDDGNYYTVLPSKINLPDVVNHKITKQLSKKRLAHRYMKQQGIKDKCKEDLLVKILKESEQ